MVVEEVLKVRGGSDVVLKTRFTRHGPVIDSKILKGDANDLNTWVPREVYAPIEMEDKSKVHSYAWAYDPIVQELNGFSQPHLINFRILIRQFANIHNPDALDGEAFVKFIHDHIHFPLNMMVVLENNDIIYGGCGLYPDRNVAMGSFTKVGNVPETMWKGIHDSKDLPYVVNPEKGYLVSCNNFLGTKRMKNGVSLGRTFPSRKVRISEMLEEFIDSGKKINVADCQKV
jgi:acyl-homoserine lactone acylase PvdQ